MEKTRKIILEHNNSKLISLDYYLSIIEKVEENIETMPDICIESCKSLIEGVSKTILNYFNEEYKDSGRNADTVRALYKRASYRLSLNEDFEQDLFNNACGLIDRVNKIRNDRGDISHGKESPKANQSTKFLSSLIVSMTDGIVSYLLNSFFHNDWSDQTQLDYYSEKVQKFNEYLDENFGDNFDEYIRGDLGINVSYSKLLYDYEYAEYDEQFYNYILSSEENE